MAKRMVQTGANTQAGGLKEGLFKEAYHPLIEGVVTEEPKKATPNAIPRLIKSGVYFFIRAVIPPWFCRRSVRYLLRPRL